MITKDVRQLNSASFQHKAGTIGEILTKAEDVGQCLETIATTEKGTVPHNPNLGASLMQFQDKPINIVAPKMKVILIKDFTVQEPRAQVNLIEFDYTDSKNGHIKAKISYTLKTSNETYTKEFQLW